MGLDLDDRLGAFLRPGDSQKGVERRQGFAVGQLDVLDFGIGARIHPLAGDRIVVMQHEHAVGRQNQIDFRAPAPDFDRLFERSDGILGRSLGFPISPMRDDLGPGLGLQRSN